MIPKEILDQGTKTIVSFLLDLFRSPEGEALYRSKIMTVGFEKVGKTTFLDCLFPIHGHFRSNFFWIPFTYFFVLQGNYLMQFCKRETCTSSWRSSKPEKTFELKNKEWKVEMSEGSSDSKKKGKEEEEDRELYGIVLSQINPDRQRQKIEIFTVSQEEREAWMTRLKRICFNEATHGIAIANPDMNEHPVVAKEMKRRKKETGKEARLELSVWDFAGQHDYYYNHHYFLSTRTVFLVLYRLDEGEKGLEGLSFWIKSLSAYLDPSTCNLEFSIVIVGTYLDCLDETQRSMKERRESKVEETCLQHGLDVGIHYFEVSCSTLENITSVEEAIYSSMFDHTYMGERVPKNYLVVERAVKELRRSNKDLPMAAFGTIFDHCKGQLALEPGILKRALSLLSLFGENVSTSKNLKNWQKLSSWIQSSSPKESLPTSSAMTQTSKLEERMELSTILT